MITLYGISNCDTMRKARQWLVQHRIAYRFHDYRRDGLEPEQLRAWVDELGWEALVNRHGRTWRDLPEPARETMDAAQAIAAMHANPSLIRRPLLDDGQQRHLGFSPESYQTLLGAQPEDSP